MPSAESAKSVILLARSSGVSFNGVRGIDAGSTFGMLAPDDGRDEQTYAIIGAAMEVHRVLGHGFVEAPYAASLRIELRRRGIPFCSEVCCPLSYKGESLALSYRPDLICCDSIVVEVKALPGSGGNEVGQVINYLRASGLRRGLLLNFGARSLGYRRIVFGPKSV